MVGVAYPDTQISKIIITDLSQIFFYDNDFSLALILIQLSFCHLQLNVQQNESNPTLCFLLFLQGKQKLIHQHNSDMQHHMQTEVTKDCLHK